MPLPIPLDYVQTLGRRSKGAIKGILTPPFKMTLNTYYPLPPQPPRPSPQCDVPSRRPLVQQSPPPQQCFGTRVVAAEKTTVERSAKNTYMEGHNEGGMDLDPGGLEQSSAGTNQLKPPSAGTCVETTRQQCLPNSEMGRTTVDGCLLVVVSSNLGETLFLSPNSLSRPWPNFNTFCLIKNHFPADESQTWKQ